MKRLNTRGIQVLAVACIALGLGTGTALAAKPAGTMKAQNSYVGDSAAPWPRFMRLRRKVSRKAVTKSVEPLSEATRCLFLNS